MREVLSSGNPIIGKGVDFFDKLHTDERHRDELTKRFKNIVPASKSVRVIGNEGVFVGCVLVSLYKPIYGRFAINGIVIGLGGISSRVINAL